MGLFTPTSHYSTHEHHLSGENIRHILFDHLPEIKGEHKTLAYEAVHAKRGEDKKISLDRIHGVLQNLVVRQEIGENDKHEMMQEFEKFFKEHLS